ncbi:hypothetical protein Zmor_007444 [Zophobas morio]|uniref:Uncharacterized protein n=1 Tax=Zophobas morio TaxID=2755281 RepID=A0AA38ITY7_9CUCU|nr:hypothetical protein Zmor_007444 [Zophobas morio]
MINYEMFMSGKRFDGINRFADKWTPICLMLGYEMWSNGISLRCVSQTPRRFNQVQSLMQIEKPDLVFAKGDGRWLFGYCPEKAWTEYELLV